MKLSLVILTLAGCVATAQTVDVKGLPADQDGSTTIRVEKNRPEYPPPGYARPNWEVHDGTADVEGDTSATARDAKAAWKEACEKWKKEFKDDNKENKVLSVNCGTASCGGEAGNMVCTSKATYKVKTRVD